MNRRAKRLRYRTDPTYRLKILQKVKVRHERDNSDPLYREIVNIRKRICARRNTLAIYLEKVEKLELDLLGLIDRRDELVKRRKKRAR